MQLSPRLVSTAFSNVQRHWFGAIGERLEVLLTTYQFHIVGRMRLLKLSSCTDNACRYQPRWERILEGLQQLGD